MDEETTEAKIKVENYGDMLAAINDLELVSYEEYGSYQGDYLAVLKDKTRLFYYVGSFGSCSGCDWLEAERDWEDETVSYKKAVEYCGDIKPSYIVPVSVPLKFKYEDYELVLDTTTPVSDMRLDDPNTTTEAGTSPEGSRLTSKGETE